MWIRSQDRKVLKDCNNIMVNYNKPTEIISDVGYSEPDSANYIILGEYATEERAIQVIDEIHNQLANVTCIETRQISSASGYLTAGYCEEVYQMPMNNVHVLQHKDIKEGV